MAIVEKEKYFNPKYVALQTKREVLEGNNSITFGVILAVFLALIIGFFAGAYITEQVWNNQTEMIELYKGIYGK